MSLIQKYLGEIESSKVRTRLYIGSDALFLVFRYTETAIDLKRSATKRKKYRVTAVLMLTSFGVQRLEPTHHNYRDIVDNIVSKLKYGSVDSQSTLLAAMGQYRTNYGTLKLKLTPTRLERYI